MPPRIIPFRDHWTSNRSSILDWNSWVTLPTYVLVYVKSVLLALILATVGAVVPTSGELSPRPAVAVWTLLGGVDIPISFALREILLFALIAKELWIGRP